MLLSKTVDKLWAKCAGHHESCACQCVCRNRCGQEKYAVVSSWQTQHYYIILSTNNVVLSGLLDNNEVSVHLTQINIRIHLELDVCKLL